MGSLRFGVYFTQGESFGLGETVMLDCYDGFFDQALDHLGAGHEIRFVADDGSHGLPPATVEQLLGWRRALPDQLLLTARLLEPGGGETRVQIIAEQAMRDVLQEVDQHGDRVTQEILSNYDGLWRGPGAYGSDSRYVLACELPSLHHVRHVASDAADGAFRIQQDVILKRRQPGHATITTGMVLEPSANGKAVRVFVPGDNDPESSLVYDIVDVDGYARELEVRAHRARSGDERALWSYLLGPGR